MSGPKDLSFDDIKPKAQSEADPEAASAPAPVLETPPPSENAQANASGVQYYASRFASQRYHPVVLIGSAAAGKTVLLLSLLAFFKTNSTGNRLSVFFGDDLFRPADSTLKAEAKRYFDLTVADYIRGTTDGATKIGKPMFIPAKVSGESSPELKFAFMESDGEWYQPNRGPGAKEFVAPFKPELEALLTQFPDGISFIWVAPHMTGTPLKDGGVADADELMLEANESLRGAFQNYQELRRVNSARDTHMFLVTKWDTHLSEMSSADLRQNLDRANDARISHEVENFILKTYAGPYGTFQALNSPIGNKVVFRYSAGRFASRIKGPDVSDDVLRTYPRDVWNWLYEGMKKGHEWNLDSGTLLPKPAPPKLTFLQRCEEFMAAILG